MKIRTRMVPSPTGNLHLGNAHTFLFNYAFTKKNGGEVILRFEDTDTKRNQPGSEENIQDALKWLGLDWDGPVSRQSERRSNDLNYAKQLIDSGDAYYCYHTTEELEAERKEQEARGQAPRYSGACRTLSPEQIKKYQDEGRQPSIRFRVTGEDRPKEIKYTDLVFGEISYDPENFGDFVIIRSDNSVLYNFANVIDDHEDAITHIIRGNSHLTNTPRQILMYQALGWDVPQFAHLPDILNPDRVGKLSKRYGAAAITELRDQWYLPEALVNFMGSLGWSHPDGKEFFDLEEMIRVFDFHRVGKAPPAMDIDRLDYYNQHYLSQKSDSKITEITKEAFPSVGDTNFLNQTANSIAPLLKGRINNKQDIQTYAGYFFMDPHKPDFKFADYEIVLKLAEGTLESLDPWTKEKIEEALRSVQQSSDIKPKDFFVTIGQAISGQDVFLPLFDTLEILGKEKTLQRLKANL